MTRRRRLPIPISLGLALMNGAVLIASACSSGKSSGPATSGAGGANKTATTSMGSGGGGSAGGGGSGGISGGTPGAGGDLSDAASPDSDADAGGGGAPDDGGSDSGTGGGGAGGGGGGGGAGGSISDASCTDAASTSDGAVTPSMTFGTGVGTIPKHFGDIDGPVENNPAPTIIKVTLKNQAEAVKRVLADATGNVFVLTGTLTDSFITGYDPSLKQIWQVKQSLDAPALAVLQDIALSSDGSIVTIGSVSSTLPGEVPSGGVDVLVGKYAAADGKLLWMHQWGSTDDDYGNFVTVAPDGSILGYAQTGSSFSTCQYKADGTLETIMLSGYLPSLPATVDGKVYGVDSTDGELAQYDVTGTVSWTLDVTQPPPTDPVVIHPPLDADGMPVPQEFGHVAPNPNGDIIYFWNPLGTFGAVNSNGGYLWYRAVTDKSADIGCGVLWTGSFTGDPSSTVMAVTTDAIYVAGSYTNAYKASPPPAAGTPSTFPAYVARYDLLGNVQWFKEFTIVDSVLGGPTDVVQDYPNSLSPLVNGNVVVNMETPAGWLLFKLDSADGSLL